MAIKILDCTLRDGGYINNWEFGKNNIETIISKLSNSNIEIIECGFLSNKELWSEDQSKFNSIKDIEKYIANPNSNTMYVGMINLGEFDIENLQEYKNGIISGLRLVFHKHQVDEAIEYANELKNKGYNVFIQPMVTISYSDIELLELIEKVNNIKPYAFYMVDSFGVMKQNDIKRMFYLIDNNLDKNICIGYHAHNNLQLAYSNAQSLVNIQLSRCIIIDSSVFGMGRGAGNLNTELFTNYLNDTIEKNYIIEPLLEIIDDILNAIYVENYWGYSLAHYLSAKFNCHPNYASYLSDKNVLTINGISDILRIIDADKKANFDKKYIEKLYIKYQENNINDIVDIALLKKELEGKEVLVLAPGKSIKTCSKDIKENIQSENIVTIAINFVPDDIEINYLFISNLKRYHNISESYNLNKLYDKLILTSNIKDISKSRFIVNYNNLLNEFSDIEDNAGLLLIKLLIKCGVKSIVFAGFDGYSYDYALNYVSKDLTLPINQKNIKNVNRNMKLAIEYFNKEIEINFITPSMYDYNK